MSEQENVFLGQLKKWIIGGLTGAISIVIASMVIFFLNANGRIVKIEETQSQKVNASDFQHYKDYQELKDSYIYQSIEEMKTDLKQLKNQ